ncbi:MAG: hypothetical protein HYV07_01115 [Deltaproteobacteria bacterium]|nr:hypothetical protein [Deltaproteobacteria bacterium]
MSDLDLDIRRVGARTARECDAWAEAFALEPEVIRDAFAGYLAILEASGEPPKDADLASGLSKLRRDLKKSISRSGSERAKDLDDMLARLSRSIERMDVLAEVDEGGALVGLRPRLVAAHALVSAVQAAFGRSS